MLIDVRDFYLQKLSNLQQLSTVENYEQHFKLLHSQVVSKYGYLQESYFVECCIQGFIKEIQEFVILFSPSSVESCFKLALMKETLLTIAAVSMVESKASNETICQSDNVSSIEDEESALAISNEVVIVEDAISVLANANVLETLYCGDKEQSGDSISIGASNGSDMYSLENLLVEDDVPLVVQQNEALIVTNVGLSRTLDLLDSSLQGSEVVATVVDNSDNVGCQLVKNNVFCDSALAYKYDILTLTKEWSLVLYRTSIEINPWCNLLAFKGGTYHLPPPEYDKWYEVEGECKLFSGFISENNDQQVLVRIVLENSESGNRVQGHWAISSISPLSDSELFFLVLDFLDLFSLWLRLCSNNKVVPIHTDSNVGAYKLRVYVIRGSIQQNNTQELTTHRKHSIYFFLVHTACRDVLQHKIEPTVSKFQVVLITPEDCKFRWEPGPFPTQLQIDCRSCWGRHLSISINFCTAKALSFLQWFSSRSAWIFLDIGLCLVFTAGVQLIRPFLSCKACYTSAALFCVNSGSSSSVPAMMVASRDLPSSDFSHIIARQNYPTKSFSKDIPTAVFYHEHSEVGGNTTSGGQSGDTSFQLSTAQLIQYMDFYDCVQGLLRSREVFRLSVHASWNPLQNGQQLVPAVATVQAASMVHFVQFSVLSGGLRTVSTAKGDFMEMFDAFDVHQCSYAFALQPLPQVLHASISSQNFPVLLSNVCSIHELWMISSKESPYAIHTYNPKIRLYDTSSYCCSIYSLLHSWFFYACHNQGHNQIEDLFCVPLFC